MLNLKSGFNLYLKNVWNGNSVWQCERSHFTITTFGVLLCDLPCNCTVLVDSYSTLYRCLELIAVKALNQDPRDSRLCEPVKLTLLVAYAAFLQSFRHYQLPVGCQNIVRHGLTVSAVKSQHSTGLSGVWLARFRGRGGSSATSYCKILFDSVHTETRWVCDDAWTTSCLLCRPQIHTCSLMYSINAIHIRQTYGRRCKLETCLVKNPVLTRHSQVSPSFPDNIFALCIHIVTKWFWVFPSLVFSTMFSLTRRQ